MRCQDAQERMWHCLDQNVKDMELKRHLATCRECTHMWQDMQQFEREISKLKLEHPAAGFIDRVMERVERERLDHKTTHTRNRWTTWNHLWLASAATFVFLFLGGGTELDGSSGLPTITVYALKFGWTVAEIAEQVPKLF